MTSVCKYCGKERLKLGEIFEEPYPIEGTNHQAPNIPIVGLLLTIKLELRKKPNWCLEKFRICSRLENSPYSAAENVLYALLEDYHLEKEWGPTMKT